MVELIWVAASWTLVAGLVVMYIGLFRVRRRADRGENVMLVGMAMLLISLVSLMGRDVATREWTGATTLWREKQIETGEALSFLFETTTRLNVRAEPNASSRIVVVLAKGQRVQIRRSQKDRGEWVFAETANGTALGYLNRKHVAPAPATGRVAHALFLLGRAVNGIWSVNGLISTILTVGVAVLFARSHPLARWTECASAIIFSTSLAAQIDFSVGMVHSMSLGWEGSIAIFIDVWVGILLGAIVHTAMGVDRPQATPI